MNAFLLFQLSEGLSVNTTQNAIDLLAANPLDFAMYFMAIMLVLVAAFSLIMARGIANMDLDISMENDMLIKIVTELESTYNPVN